MSDAPVVPTPEVPAVPETPEPPKGKFFTDEDMQRIMSKEGKQEVRKLATDLGFENADQLKSFIAEVQERKEAEKTEAERTRDAAEQVRKAAEQERNAANAERHSVNVERQLLRAGVPPEKLDYITKLVSSEAGASAEDISADIETLKTQLPELFALPTAAPTWTPDSRVQGKPPTSGPGADDPMTMGQRRAEEFVKRPGYNPLA